MRLTLLSCAIWAFATACTCERARTDIPRLEVPFTSEPPVIDGVLSDPIWTRAGHTERFVDTMSGAPANLEVRAHLAYDAEALYVAFEVRDTLLRSSFEGHDAHLWEQDAVELMIDPDGDGLRYVELQVSPTNLVFDTWFDSRRAPAPFGHIAWNSQLRSAVRTRGTPNDDEADDGYTVEIAVPFASLAPMGGSAPRSGTEWRLALYVLDALAEGQRGVGWSPPLVGDFHVPERFAHLRFMEQRP